MYIDYGNMSQCEITKLANLELFDPLLTKIAPQVFKNIQNSYFCIIKIIFL